MSDYPMIACDDSEMFSWINDAAGRGGSFLRMIAKAALHADAENYAILRPALLQLKAKYQKYGKDVEPE